jgi:hypothetical protein
MLAAHLAAGVLAVTAFLALGNRLPDSFVRFATAASVVSASLASLLGGGTTAVAYGGLAGAAVLWHVWLRRGWSHKSVPALVAVAASLVALIVECRGSGSSGLLLSVAGALSSSLLLGSVSVSMVLGHWYLIVPKLSIAPLKQGTLWLVGALAMRSIVVASVLATRGWGVVQITRASDVFFSTLGLFFLIRTITGLAAPLLLIGLIWQTVKMRSTQSATGLLYVALVLVLFGELISQFLTVATGLPL